MSFSCFTITIRNKVSHSEKNKPLSPTTVKHHDPTHSSISWPSSLLTFLQPQPWPLLCQSLVCPHYPWLPPPSSPASFPINPSSASTLVPAVSPLPSPRILCKPSRRSSSLRTPQFLPVLISTQSEGDSPPSPFPIPGASPACTQVSLSRPY